MVPSLLCGSLLLASVPAQFARGGYGANLELLVRWVHVLAGIVWIGHLYFFNFVNVPFQGTMDKDAKRKVNPALLPRALWWFRWGAMVTLLAGLVLFWKVYLYDELLWEGPREAGKMSERSMWAMMGMLFGAVMWFNVWFVIWPAQKKILGWVRDGQAPPEMPGLAKRALMFSRTNAFLSGPMLFGMIAPHHYSSINPLTAVLAIALGLLAIECSIKISSKVGTSV